MILLLGMGLSKNLSSDLTKILKTGLISRPVGDTQGLVEKKIEAMALHCGCVPKHQRASETVLRPT